MNDEDIASFREILFGLRSVFFYQPVMCDARFMCDVLDMAEVRFNRSYPVHALAEELETLDPDPRPIDADLEKLSVGWDPRERLYQWLRMKRSFGVVTEGRAVEMSF